MNPVGPDRDSAPGARLAWLRLARTPGLGPVGLARLIDRYKTPEAALDALPRRCRKAGKPIPAIPDRDAIEAELDAIDQAGATLLTPLDPAFPDLLRAIPAAPATLILKGRLDLFDRTGCAMVGARNASAAGLRFARDLALQLGQEGVCVISGLARGIDGACHVGALDTGTIAVLAGGIDHIYPPEHAQLHDAIAETGLLVCEMPLGAIPRAKDFPRRNRIISGLSRGTVVVEAALRSGSLITARFAMEQGREVMAVPGSPLDPRARGSNQLLRDGAHLIESAEDVLDILGRVPAIPLAPRPGLEDGAGPTADLFADEADYHGETVQTSVAATGHADPPAMHPEPGREDPTDRVTALLSPVPVSPDEIARQAALPVSLVQAVLMELEFDGHIARTAGGHVQILPRQSTERAGAQRPNRPHQAVEPTQAR